MPRNETLIAARLQHNLTQKELAQALGVTTRTIRGWESGTTRPQPAQLRDLIAYMGVSEAEELGIPAPNRRGPRGRVAGGRFQSDHPDTAPSHALDWFAAPAELAIHEPIDEEYVNGLRENVTNLVQIDRRYGGNEASPLILRAFRQIRRRMDSSEIRKGLDRDIHAVAAEVAEIAGWSLYDANENVMAERVNNEAMRLAHLAGDRSMELFVLQNMAMQAGHLGRVRESLNIAHLVISAGRLTPRLEALFRIRKARALAQLTAERDARYELSLARSLFLEGSHEDDPTWAWWVDGNEFAWHEGMIELHLGEIRKCAELFQTSAQGVPGHRVRTSYNHQASALMAHVLNKSWTDAEIALRSLLSYCGLVGSGRTDQLLELVLLRIDRANTTDTTRDLARALRRALTDSASMAP